MRFRCDLCAQGCKAEDCDLKFFSYDHFLMSIEEYSEKQLAICHARSRTVRKYYTYNFHQFRSARVTVQNLFLKNCPDNSIIFHHKDRKIHTFCDARRCCVRKFTYTVMRLDSLDGSSGARTSRLRLQGLFLAASRFLRRPQPHARPARTGVGPRVRAVYEVDTAPAGGCRPARVQPLRGGRA